MKAWYVTDRKGYSDYAVIVFAETRGVQLGWLASQADMLAEDWRIAPHE